MEINKDNLEKALNSDGKKQKIFVEEEIGYRKVLEFLLGL